jgi:hypothetical protein
LQLEEEEEMEGADSDADGNTNATYEVLTTTRAIYSEKTVATTVKKINNKNCDPQGVGEYLPRCWAASSA